MFSQLPRLTTAAATAATITGKAFRHPHSLREHLFGHAKIKPFKCPYPGGCDKDFTSASNMRRHMKRAHKNLDAKEVSRLVREASVVAGSKETMRYIEKKKREAAAALGVEVVCQEVPAKYAKKYMGKAKGKGK